MNSKIQIIDVIRGTTVDGPGFRTSVYFSGCSHQCPGCHNPQSWDFSSGKAMDIEEIMEIIREEDFDVTLTGGDPLYHPETVKSLVEEINKTGHSVWIYTGFTWEEIYSSPRLSDAVAEAEVVVEGRFIKDMRDESLRFRGSRNQRIIRVKDGVVLEMD